MQKEIKKRKLHYYTTLGTQDTGRIQTKQKTQNHIEIIIIQ
jgi:hypothetical protein